MKMTQLITNAGNGKANHSPRQAGPGLTNHQSLLSLARTERSCIQWPTGQQLQDVSKQLVRISREGKRCELNGDYFKSGDTAFQIQEIIRATADLFRRTQRPKA